MVAPWTPSPGWPDRNWAAEYLHGEGASGTKQNGWTYACVVSLYASCDRVASEEVLTVRTYVGRQACCRCCCRCCCSLLSVAWVEQEGELAPPFLLIIERRRRIHLFAYEPVSTEDAMQLHELVLSAEQLNCFFQAGKRLGWLDGWMGSNIDSNREGVSQTWSKTKQKTVRTGERVKRSRIMHTRSALYNLISALPARSLSALVSDPPYREAKIHSTPSQIVTSGRVGGHEYRGDDQYQQDESRPLSLTSVRHSDSSVCTLRGSRSRSRSSGETITMFHCRCPHAYTM